MSGNRSCLLKLFHEFHELTDFRGEGDSTLFLLSIFYEVSGWSVETDAIYFQNVHFQIATK